MNSGRVDSSCSTCVTRRATIMVNSWIILNETRTRLGLRHKDCDYDKRNVITTKWMSLRQRNVITSKGMWLRQKECDYDKGNMNMSKEMWLRQKECDYDYRNVITTKGMWSWLMECTTHYFKSSLLWREKNMFYYLCLRKRRWSGI
jgi:hypothetical protein